MKTKSPAIDDGRAPVSAADVLLLLAVPVALLAVYQLPLALRRSLRLSYQDPTPATAFLSHFVHLDPGHLVVNLVAYLVCAGLVYLCCLLADRRWHFRILVGGFTIALPFALSGLLVLTREAGTGLGFSGIVLAWVGVLPLALVWAARRTLHLRIRPFHGLVLFFAGLVVVTVAHLPPSGTTRRLVLVIIATGALCTVRPVASVPYRDILARARARVGALELQIVAAAVYLILLATAFPASGTWNGATVNLGLHVFGFTCGFLVPFVTALLGAHGGVLPGAPGTANSAAE